MNPLKLKIGEYMEMDYLKVTRKDLFDLAKNKDVDVHVVYKDNALKIQVKKSPSIN